MPKIVYKPLDYEFLVESEQLEDLVKNAVELAALIVKNPKDNSVEAYEAALNFLECYAVRLREFNFEH